MAPWMVIVALVGAGFAVLLVAPTVHRSINARSRAGAESARLSRVNALRSSPEGAMHVFPDATGAVKTRDRLLLRGVRAEVVHENGATLLVHRANDSAVVEAVMNELGIE